uniref:Uncharacterized protein n=1 Tax=Zea mays TaxID=4577 RepID=B6TZ23_MAIZE|nr:hypothetical protein [Zea mays]
MVAPTTATARLLQADTSPVFGLDIIAREFGHPDGAIYCGESCVLIPCISSVIGCRCENKVCVHRLKKPSSSLISLSRHLRAISCCFHDDPLCVKNQLHLL